MKLFSDKNNGLLNFSDLKKGNVRILYLFMFLFLVIMAVICIFPILWVTLSAFKTPEEMYRVPPTLFPHSFNMQCVSDIFGKINIMSYVKNTLFIIAGCWIIDITINGLSGYVLSKIRPKGSVMLETLIFWSMMIPNMGLAPLYKTIVDFPLLHVNLSGSFLPLWLMAGCSAFNILIIRNFFNGIPIEYIEAAKIDGCSDFKIFLKIMLPLAKPVIAVISIYSILGSWNNFMWPYLLLGGTNREPLSILLFQISNGSFPIKDNEVLMIAMLACILPIIIYMFLSRHIEGGLNMSGIKG